MGAGKIFHEPYEDSASWPVHYEAPDFPRPAKAPVNGGANFDWSPVNVSDEELGDYKTITRGIDFLQEQHDKPFFLAIGLIRPHLPWYVPQKYFDMYPLEKIVLPKTISNDLDDLPAMGKLMATTIYGTVGTPQATRELSDHELYYKTTSGKKQFRVIWQVFLLQMLR